MSANEKNDKSFFALFVIVSICNLLMFFFLVKIPNETWDTLQVLDFFAFLIVLFFSIIPFIFSVIIGIKKYRSLSDLMSKNKILLMLLFIIIPYVLFILFGLSNLFPRNVNNIKNSNVQKNNNQKNNAANSTNIKLLEKKSFFVEPLKIIKDSVEYNDFLDYIEGDNILYRDDRDYGGFKIYLTVDKKLLLFKITDDEIIYNEMNHYLNDINNPDRRYDKGYHADYNNGGVPNTRIRIDKYEDDQSVRTAYMWYTYDSNGYLIEYSEYIVES